jgi:hypothetical protein
MKRNRLLNLPVVATGVYFIFKASLSAIWPYIDPAAQGTTFTIIFPDNSSVTATSNNLVGLQPNQIVEVDGQLAWGGTCVGDPFPTITLELLDGGTVASGTTTVTTDGCGGFTFNFQAPANPGVSQINLVGYGTAIQFWVIDPDDPTNHPPTIN